MRFLKYIEEDELIQERFYGKVSKTDVFINPTDKEFDYLLKKNPDGEFRFWLDFKNQNLYVWNVNHLHGDIVQSIMGDNYNYKKMWEDNVWAVGYWEDNVFHFVESDEMGIEFNHKKLQYLDDSRLSFIEKWKGKDDWTKGYFGKSFIAIIEDIIK